MLCAATCFVPWLLLLYPKGTVASCFVCYVLTHICAMGTTALCKDTAPSYIILYACVMLHNLCPRALPLCVVNTVASYYCMSCTATCPCAMSTAASNVACCALPHVLCCGYCYNFYAKDTVVSYVTYYVLLNFFVSRTLLLHMLYAVYCCMYCVVCTATLCQRY